MLKYSEEYNAINTLLSFLRSSKVVELVKQDNGKHGNLAPSELIRTQIELVQGLLDNASDSQYVLVDVDLNIDYVEGVRFIKSFGSRQDSLDYIQEIQNRYKESVIAYREYRERFVTKLLETVVVPEKYEERQKFCEKYGISRHTPPDMVFQSLVRSGKFWGNPDYEEPRIEYLGNLEIVEVS